jgi:hypothetical protein
MDRYVNISTEEMSSFLKNQGFSRMTLSGTNEVVYGIREDRDGFKLSLRIYTACNDEKFGGQSRKKGKDAIRIILFVRYNGEVKQVNSKKCLRVKNWQKNIISAKNSILEDWRLCSCGHPMVIRTNSKTQKDFWSCLTYFETKCTGTIRR